MIKGRIRGVFVLLELNNDEKKMRTTSKNINLFLFIILIKKII